MTYLTAQLTPQQLHRTVASMEIHGGGFCRALAQAWYKADPRNKQRIEHAFEHILVDFAPGSRLHEGEQ
jgi:hypothetical protein